MMTSPPRLLALLTVVMLFQSHGADASAVPQFLPDRDVEVQYTVTAPGRSPHEYDLSFSAESERLRIDDPAHGLWFLVDLRDASATLVVPQMHVVVTEPDLANLTSILQGAHAAQFTPLGEATIAGLRCTRYRVHSEQASGTACLTRNGIALAVSGQDKRGSAQVVADSVTEATVPPDNLVPPPDFPSITLPRGTIEALLGN
jgi:hypothetical protein